MTVRIRMQPAARKDFIMEKALIMAERDGINQVGQIALAAECGISTGLIFHHYGTIKQLRRDIVRAAIKHINLKVLGEAVVLRHPATDALPDELKQQALSSLQS